MKRKMIPRRRRRCQKSRHPRGWLYPNSYNIEIWNSFIVCSRSRPSEKRREDARLDGEIDDLLEPDESRDSIIDSSIEQGDDDSDDDEVDEILG